MEKISNVSAIKKFFSTPEFPVEMAEMKALTKEDRDELGPLCREALEAQAAAEADKAA